MTVLFKTTLYLISYLFQSCLCSEDKKLVNGTSCEEISERKTTLPTGFNYSQSSSKEAELRTTTKTTREKLKKTESHRSIVIGIVLFLILVVGFGILLARRNALGNVSSSVIR